MSDFDGNPEDNFSQNMFLMVCNIKSLKQVSALIFLQIKAYNVKSLSSKHGLLLHLLGKKKKLSVPCHYANRPV